MEFQPSQPTVFEPSDAQYGLFYWIYLNNGIFENDDTIRHILNSCSRIHHTAQRVDDPTGLKVGVGFGQKVLQRIPSKSGRPNYLTKFSKDLEYRDRKKRKNIVLPSTGGDIFVHAKGKDVGTLYEFQHVFYNTLPEGSVDLVRTNVTRGFKFQHHRDISGYMDGIANPATADENRIEAVLEITGGSFVITQKWEHDMNVVRVERPDNVTVEEQNLWIGRKRENGRPVLNRPPTAHVELMKQVQEGGRHQRIVRQSLPYTEEHGPTGLFFLAYANNTRLFNTMLDTMTQGDGDLLFRMSSNTRGAYWYFPGMNELRDIYLNTPL